jgi:hypothetical protein
MDDYRTVRIVIEAEVRLDASVNEIAADLVATAEDRHDVLAAWWDEHLGTTTED